MSGDDKSILREAAQARQNGLNGRSVTSKTWHGPYSNVTRVTGPNGGSRIYLHAK